MRTEDEQLSRAYDYVAVGHVTRDVIEDADGGPRAQPGGGAFYSGLQAARLGLRTLIVTSGAPGEVEQLLGPFRSELDVQVIPSEQTTTLATHGSGADRVQRVRAWAGPIAGPLQVSAAIVHFAPVARETPPGAHAQAKFIGVTPQGLVRNWDRDGRLLPAELDPATLPERFHAAVISEQERASCAALFAVARHRALVAVTAGFAPTELCLACGTAELIAPLAIGPACDDLGAGDVFASALFVALAEGSSPAEAARHASAAAAVRVSGCGPDAVGDSAAVERLLNAQP